MKKQKLIIALCAALLAAIPLGVLAVRTLLRPASATDGYYSDVVNRVSFAAENTSFVFRKTAAGAETMQAELTLTLKKCEPDFYAVLRDLRISGMAYENAEFICETAGMDGEALPGDVFLPVRDGAAAPLVYRVLLTFTADGAQTFTPTLDVEYTSGLTAESADERLLRIPLTIRVEE